MRRSIISLRSLPNKWSSGSNGVGKLLQHNALMSTQAKRILIKENYEVVSPFPDVEPSKADICTLMLDTARRFPQHTAVECGFTGLSYTYGQLLDRSLRYATYLQRVGINRGDVVAIFLPNGPHYPLAYIGSMASGACTSCINASFTAPEVKMQLEDSGSKIIIVDPLLEHIVQETVSSMLNPPLVHVTGPSKFSKANILEIVEEKNIPFFNFTGLSPEDKVVLQYSSGTTGLPKGAIVQHKAVSAHLPMMHHPDIIPNKAATKDSQECIVGLLPLFHAYGMYAILLSGLILGLKIVTLPQLKPDVFLAAHLKNKVEVIHLVPPMLQFLAYHPSVKPDHLQFIKVAMCAAAPCPAEAARSLKAKAPNPVFFQEGYGMTETFPTNYTPLTGPEKLGSCGPLMPNCQAKVLDIETNEALAPGATGELCVRSPALMSGYHDRPEATAEIYTPDGWLRTGDVAKYDEDGYFYIVDRIKELIKVKGAQVAPSELENQLLQLPGVADVGVVGVDDSRAGELPRAYVVKSNPDLTEDEVKAFLQGKVAPYKQLEGGVRFVKDLPKSAAGKLLRKQLKHWTTQE